MPDMLGYALIAAIGLALSAMYSGLETGLYTINRVRMTVRASHGDARASRLRRLLDSPNRMLSTLLIGNNIANYAGSFGIAAILNVMGFSPVQAVAINAGILVPVLFVFGETLPKDLFRTHTDRWSYRLSAFLTWSMYVFTWTGLAPIVQAVGYFASRLFGSDATQANTARQRISQLIAEGVGAGVLSESQTSLVNRALALRDVRVSSEMIPWRRVAWLRADAGDAQRRQLFRRVNYSRAPVLAPDGSVLGSLSAITAAIEPTAPTDSLVEDMVSLHPADRVRDALGRMQQARCPMAVVLQPKSRKPIGIVTFKDLVEPLTGELETW